MTDLFELLESGQLNLIIQVRGEDLLKFTEDIFADLKAKEDLVMDKSWESYVVDPFDIRNNPEDTAVVFLNGEPFFWRGNIYLVSGYAGVMKSFLCLIIAAAVINRGTNADKTLSFHTFDSNVGPFRGYRTRNEHNQCATSCPEVPDGRES